MAGADDEWPILADPKPDDEGWPLQPNNAPGPPPTELRPADQPFPTYQSKPDSLASQVQCIAGITCVCLAVLTLISAAIGFFLPQSHHPPDHHDRPYRWVNALRHRRRRRRTFR